jgi:threonine aldolase
VIDLRSDTVTQPTAAMRRAIADAVVGDEQKLEDPTVAALQRRAAELLGQEVALFVPTATMANQIAMRLLGRPGGQLVAHEHSHVLIHEHGGPALHAGLMTHGVRGSDGRVSPDQVRLAVTTADDTQPVEVVSLENTHNSSGGRVWALAEIDQVAAVCREAGVRMHLDGARLMNAVVASGVPAAEFGRRFDTVTLCLSKGLGCPLGALIAGSAELMARGWRWKHAFGGAMRQAGIVAAAGLYALDHHVERLAEDHARARRLAEGLVEAGLPVDLEQVETNFVQLDVGPLGLTPSEAIERLRGGGVGLSETVHPTILRAVTHLGITDEDVETAIEAIPAALGVLARV